MLSTFLKICQPVASKCCLQLLKANVVNKLPAYIQNFSDTLLIAHVINNVTLGVWAPLLTDEQYK